MTLSRIAANWDFLHRLNRVEEQREAVDRIYLGLLPIPATFLPHHLSQRDNRNRWIIGPIRKLADPLNDDCDEAMVSPEDPAQHRRGAALLDAYFDYDKYEAHHEAAQGDAMEIESMTRSKQPQGTYSPSSSMEQAMARDPAQSSFGSNFLHNVSIIKAFGPPLKWPIAPLGAAELRVYQEPILHGGDIEQQLSAADNQHEASPTGTRDQPMLESTDLDHPHASHVALQDVLNQLPSPSPIYGAHYGLGYVVQPAISNQLPPPSPIHGARYGLGYVVQPAISNQLPPPSPIHGARYGLGYVVQPAISNQLSYPVHAPVHGGFLVQPGISDSLAPHAGGASNVQQFQGQAHSANDTSALQLQQEFDMAVRASADVEPSAATEDSAQPQQGIKRTRSLQPASPQDTNPKRAKTEPIRETAVNGDQEIHDDADPEPVHETAVEGGEEGHDDVNQEAMRSNTSSNVEQEDTEMEDADKSVVSDTEMEEAGGPVASDTEMEEGDKPMASDTATKHPEESRAKARSYAVGKQELRRIQDTAHWQERPETIPGPRMTRRQLAAAKATLASAAETQKQQKKGEKG